MLDMMTHLRTLHAAIGKGADLGSLGTTKRQKAPRKGKKARPRGR